MGEKTVRAERADRYGTPSPRFPAGRVCEHEGCGTRLSIYNRRPFCWQHDLPQPKPIPVRVRLRIR
jgi:hypothetical protein